ncbi:hypothetical protein D1BOALGB6SA_7788 [Olavius sp. associated proteobacterium Delta 1]|nr:hypothetical protein D1BOALGB6SA_7788 [Olavius sp. associated proteobacterium Delta 1]
MLPPINFEFWILEFGFHFCPSCHQKRVVEFGEWLCTEVLKYVPHRQ